MIGEKLKALRQKKGVTAKAVAEALKILPDTYRSYETGRREPNLETLSIIADYFNVSADYLLGRESEISEYLTESEKELEEYLIEKYRKLPEQFRKKFLQGVMEAVELQKQKEQKLEKQQQNDKAVQRPIVQSIPQRQIQQAPQQPNLQRQMSVQQPVSNEWRMAARSTDGTYISRIMTQEEIDLIESLEDVPKDRY